MRVFKPSILACAALVGIVSLTPTQGSAQTLPGASSAANKDLTAPAQSDVAKAERDLAQTNTRVQQGLATTTELSESRIRLAQARLQLAQVEDQPETVIQQAQIIVDERAQLVAHASAVYKAGVTTQSELNAARLALAEARVTLDLYTLVGIKRENTDAALRRYKAGAATEDDVKQAAHPAELGRIQALLSTELGTNQKPEHP